jgi:hypothetical protein
VGMNIAHGLPLTRADRTAAAARVVHSYPQWSDRMISTVVGLSAGTVAKVSQAWPQSCAPALTGSYSPSDKRKE